LNQRNFIIQRQDVKVLFKLAPLHFSKTLFMTPGWKGAFPALSGTESGGMVSLGMFNLYSAMEGGEKEKSNHRVISPARSQERITPSFSQSRQRAGLPPGPHSGGLLPGRGFRSRPGGISIMRHSWFHGWGGKVHPASFCGDPVGPLRTALSRPMLSRLGRDSSP